MSDCNCEAKCTMIFILPPPPPPLGEFGVFSPCFSVFKWKLYGCNMLGVFAWLNVCFFIYVCLVPFICFGFVN